MKICDHCHTVGIRVRTYTVRIEATDPDHTPFFLAEDLCDLCRKALADGITAFKLLIPYPITLSLDPQETPNENL